jgi:uncharacterized RmlC-like cupin family protein
MNTQIDSGALGTPDSGERDVLPAFGWAAPSSKKVGGLTAQMGVRVISPAHRPLTEDGPITIQRMVDDQVMYRPYAVMLEIVRATGGDVTSLRSHTGDTAILVQTGVVTVHYVRPSGSFASVTAVAGQSVFIPGGAHYALGVEFGEPMTLLAARPSGVAVGLNCLPGSGCGEVKVMTPEVFNRDDTHGIPRRWVVSSEVVGHEIGIGMTFGEVPAESSGHYHTHDVDTAIMMLSGKVLVPFYFGDEEDTLQTVVARAGEAIAIPAGWVHGPCVPYGSGMTYIACRPVGIQD